MRKEILGNVHQIVGELETKFEGVLGTHRNVAGAVRELRGRQDHLEGLVQQLS